MAYVSSSIVPITGLLLDLIAVNVADKRLWDPCKNASYPDKTVDKPGAVMSSQASLSMVQGAY